jgi:hypothetical protein
MKRLLRSPNQLPRIFVLFLALVTLASGFGGYQLSRWLSKVNDLSLQRAEQLLAVERNLDDAAIQLRMQVQEWKDMLLRANDAELYSKHRKAFMDSSIGVQYALLRTKTAMENIGMDAGVIDQLSIEHKSLVSNYLFAQGKLDPRRIESSLAVDKQIMGVDRRLQQRLADVKAAIDQLAQEHVSGTLPEYGKRFWLVGLLGASSLLVMALIGFIFAFRLLDQEDTSMEHSIAA